MAIVTVLSTDPVAVNCGIVTGSERSLIIDSGQGPGTAGILARRTEELSRAATGANNPFDVVLTHDHWDHFFGNPTLAALGAANILSSTAFSRDQEATAWIALDAIRTGPETREFSRELPTDPADLVVTTTPVADGSTLDLGDCRAQFHVLGGHSTADLVVRLVDLGIVFTGDLVEEGAPPQAGSDASLSAWAQSLRTLLDFPEARIFVPGHGLPVDRDFVAAQLADIEELRVDPGAEVVLPERSVPGDRTVPREYRL